MQSQTILSMMLLSAIALATPHEKEDTQSKEIESDRLRERWKTTNALSTNPSKSASLPNTAQTASIQTFSSVLAQDSPLSASIQATIATKASDKKAEVETVASSLSTSHPTKPSKPTSSPPSNSKPSITSTPKITAFPTAKDGALSNHTASGGSKNSTTSAPILISTTPTAASGSVTQDAATAFSTLETSSTPNVGTVQPTGVLKAAGALAVGVAGMMILL